MRRIKSGFPIGLGEECCELLFYLVALALRAEYPGMFLCFLEREENGELFFASTADIVI